MNVLKFILSLVFVAVIERVLQILESMVADTPDSDALTYDYLFAEPARQRLIF